MLPKVWGESTTGVQGRAPADRLTLVVSVEGGDATRELKVRAEQYLRERIVELQTQIQQPESH